MSTNDGGEPIRLSRAPVPKPEIRRGEHIMARSWCQNPMPGAWITFTVQTGKCAVTYHEAPILGYADDVIFVLVKPGTVVTWDVAPNPN